MRCKTLYLPTPPFFTRPGTMKKPGTLSIKEVATAEALEQAQQIRAQVLEAEQGFPHEVNIDGRDPAASLSANPPASYISGIIASIALTSP